MPLPEDYIAALEQLADAFTSYKAATGSEAVLVGGAATAILTNGAFASSDFDVVAGLDVEFGEAMRATGFVRQSERRYRLTWVHADHPAYLFEQVSGRLFDGHADYSRLIRMKVEPHGELSLPAVEDMIADRLGQHMVASPTDDSRRRQAEMLVRLAETLDRDYLYRRVRDEGGSVALLDAALLERNALRKP